jgi:hypothetical protein
MSDQLKGDLFESLQRAVNRSVNSHKATGRHTNTKQNLLAFLKTVDRATLENLVLAALIVPKLPGKPAAIGRNTLRVIAEVVPVDEEIAEPPITL